MSIEPQYTFDSLGNPIGVFLPIDDWNKISEQIHIDIPQWQKDLLDSRMAEYRKDPNSAIDWEEVSAEFRREDEAK